jgi:hypothetical protein
MGEMESLRSQTSMLLNSRQAIRQELEQLKQKQIHSISEPKQKSDLIKTEPAKSIF